MRTGLPASYPVHCLTHLSDAHFRHGDRDAANTYAQLATSLAQDADRPLDLARAHARAAQVLSFQGQWSSAQAHVRAAQDAAPIGSRWHSLSPIPPMAAASLASARNEPAGVLAATEPVRAPGMLGVGGLPGMFNWRALEADALIRLERFGEAKTALDEFEGPSLRVVYPRQHLPSLVVEGTWRWRPEIGAGEGDVRAGALTCIRRTDALRTSSRRT